MKRMLRVALVATALACICACVPFSTTVTTDVRDYPSCLSDYSPQSDLTLFPSSVSDSAEVRSFYFYGSHPVFDDEIQIALDCDYTAEEYESEIARLSTAENTHYAYPSGAPFEGYAVYDTENFEYPACVIRLGDDYTSEYALVIEDEHRIIYVFLQFVPEDDVAFDTALLPDGYSGLGDCADSYMVGED